MQVLVPQRAEFKGKMIEVDIYEAGKHFLKGRPVEDSQPFTPSIAAPLQRGEVSGLVKVNRQIKPLHRYSFFTNTDLTDNHPQIIVITLYINEKLLNIWL